MRFLLCVTIILGCGALGALAASRMDERVHQTEEAEAILMRLSFHIGFLAMPFASALCLAAKQEGTVCQIMRETAQKLSQSPSCVPEEAFMEAVRQNRRALCLQTPEINALCEMMRYVGHGDQEHIQNSIRFTLAKLKVQCESAAEIRHRDGRLYRSLGFLGGMLIVVLLL